MNPTEIGLAHLGIDRPDLAEKVRGIINKSQSQAFDQLFEAAKYVLDCARRYDGEVPPDALEQLLDAVESIPPRAS